MDNSIEISKTLEDDFNSCTAELKKGQSLGENQNYRLEKCLGAGGMGEVWLASEIRGGEEIRKVVVKTIRPDRLGKEVAQEKALNEFQFIQKLNHQNICPIYVIEKDPSYGYLIVMGYADGESYADWFKKQPKQNGGLPLKTVCDVLRPIADALDFAHLKGVIHRDVKPENMMFTSDGTPWLIDFGIASNLRTVTQATQGQYASSGTVSYMAPEQRKRKFQTAQTDEYSLAMVALEFLTGALSPTSLFKLSPELQKVLVKALDQDWSKRYATCREFIDALARVELPPSPPKPDPVGELRSVPTVSHRRSWKLPALLALVLFAALAFFFSQTPTRNTPDTSGETPSADESARPATPVSETLPTSSQHAGDRKVLTVDGIEYAFRWCPPGVFMMGGEKYDWEKPIHKVKLTKGFWLLETEVTQAMWQSVMGENPSNFKGDFNPVEQVSWEDCQSFCRKLSQKSGLRVQLPTEAQWEYACRAGTTGDYAGDLDSMAWYDSNSDAKTHEVGKKEPNPWGLYDMHGNVWEWCSDYYDKEFYARSSKSDPENRTASSLRVVRGGGWSNYPGDCRSADRSGTQPDTPYVHIGLRLAVVPGQDD